MVRQLSEFLSMTYAIKIKKNDEILKESICNIEQIIEQNTTYGKAIRAIDLWRDNRADEAIEIIKEGVMSKDRGDMIEGATCIELLYYIAESNGEQKKKIKDALIGILEFIRLADIMTAKDLWGDLRRVILKLFDESRYQKKLADIFRTNINRYNEDIIVSRYYFDALYNCTKTLKNYIDNLTDDNIQINKELQSLKDEMQQFNIPEIRAIWE